MKNETIIQKKEENPTKHRRRFLEILVKGATTLGLLSLAVPIEVKAEANNPVEPLGGDDAWFAKIKGKHRMVFDATQPAPGLGNIDIGINELQARGVMFCVCDTAIRVFSSAVAQGMNYA